MFLCVSCLVVVLPGAGESPGSPLPSALQVVGHVLPHAGMKILGSHSALSDTILAVEGTPEHLVTTRRGWMFWFAVCACVLSHFSHVRL